MSSGAADDHPYGVDKVVKRPSATGKDTLSPSKYSSFLPEVFRLVPQSLSPTSSTALAYENRIGSVNHSRSGRGLDIWTPYVLAIICLVSISAVSGSFMLARSFGESAEGSLSSDDIRIRIPPRPDVLKSLTQPGSGMSCDPKFSALNVYMYDLPSEFHFGMLVNFEPSADLDNVWPRNLSQLPRYPGALYQQHSPEYWLTADLLTSNTPERSTECTAVRVTDPKIADVFFVPFFASLSYNKYTKVEEKENNVDKNEVLQDKLIHFLRKQIWWQQSGGKNHVVVIHHPNSMHLVRNELAGAMFVVCDFGRYAVEVANIEKDIVAPYKHVIGSYNDDSGDFNTRPLLLFFQGAIVRKEGGAIRQKLYELLKDEEGVHFATGNTQKDGIKSATKGMRSSKFCLHLAGDTPSSNRLFDAIASHCIPVIISDEIELPFEDELDYSEFCLFVRGEDALKPGFVINLLRSVEKAEWTTMWKRIKEVAVHFEYQHPTQPDDAVSMVWKAIARRVPSVKLSLSKHKRYARSGFLEAPPYASSGSF